MANYEEARLKLTSTQLSKLESAAKNNNGTTLRIIKKSFQDEELPHELFVIARQKTKKRNAFAINMLTDIKLSKAQITKTIQSSGSLGIAIGNMMGILGKKIITRLSFSFG